MAGLFIYLLFVNDSYSALLRLIGVFAVLDVLGTIMTPMLRKIND